MKTVLNIAEFVGVNLHCGTPERESVSCLQHEVIDSFQRISDLQPEWDETVERYGGDLYSTFDWCRIWWQFYGYDRSLSIHLFRDKGKIVAILPMFRETLRVGPIALRVLRLVGCDFSTTTCGIVVEPESIEAVIKKFTAWLKNEPDWELIHWGPMAGYFTECTSLARVLTQNCDWTVSFTLGEPHIVWNLPDDFETFLAGLHQNERRNIRVRRKKLGEDAVILDSAATTNDLETWFPKFVEQHRTQWRAEGKLGHFEDWPRAGLFHVEQARKMQNLGRLWLLRLEIGGRPIGFQYNYCFNRRVHWLLGSRDLDPRYEAYSSGRLLLVETIEQAIQNQLTCLDGLRGMYEYKLRLGGTVTHLQNITLIRKGSWIGIKLKLLRRFGWVLDLFYYRIWFSRLAPKLVRTRTGLWERWIRWQFLSR